MKYVKMCSSVKIKYAGGIFVLLMIFYAGIGVASAAENSGKKLQVYTVNYPLAYFAQKIAKDHADVYFPGPADQDPAYWTPDAQTIARYQKADLILLNGAGYAKWVAKVSLPLSKIVDTSKKVKAHYVYTKAAVTHNHGPGGKHAHENLAFTTWLDFSIAIEQARAVKQAIIRKKSDYKKQFEQNFLVLEKELVALDRRLKAIVSQKSTQPLITSHPVYDYLSRRYAMNIKSVHWEPDETPNHDQWVELKYLLKDHPAKWMVWEGIPDSKSVAALNAMGLKSIVVSPCATQPEKMDFMSVMQQNIENLKTVYD